jgi:hypothetical protein
MVYNTQNYWVSGLCPSSSILKKTQEHIVLENECFRPKAKGWETSILVGRLETANLSHWIVKLCMQT